FFSQIPESAAGGFERSGSVAGPAGKTSTHAMPVGRPGQLHPFVRPQECTKSLSGPFVTRWVRNDGQASRPRAQVQLHVYIRGRITRVRGKWAVSEPERLVQPDRRRQPTVRDQRHLLHTPPPRVLDGRGGEAAADPSPLRPRGHRQLDEFG